MPNQDNVQIAPAEGKLGVLIPGMGAVTTTFIAGVEAIKRGLGASRSARSRSWPPSGWASAPTGAARRSRISSRWPGSTIWSSAAGTSSRTTPTKPPCNAGVLEKPLLDQVQASRCETIKPMKAVFDHEYVKRINGPNVKPKGSKMDKAEMLMDDIRSFRAVERRLAPGDDLVRLDRGVPQARRRARSRSKTSSAV